MQCMAPSLSTVDLVMSLPLSAQMGLRMDGVRSLFMLNTSLAVHQNPQVDQFSDMEFSQSVFSLTISVSI